MLSGGGWKHVPGLLRGTLGKPISEPFGGPVREPFGDAKPPADCAYGSAVSVSLKSFDGTVRVAVGVSIDKSEHEPQREAEPCAEYIAKRVAIKQPK